MASDKSLWRGLGQGLGELVGLGKPAAQPDATSTRRCEAGHPMPANERSCPYCEAERSGRLGTRVNPVEDLQPQRPGPAVGPGSEFTRPAPYTADEDRASDKRGESPASADPLGQAQVSSRSRIDTEFAPPRDVPPLQAPVRADHAARDRTRVLAVDEASPDPRPRPFAADRRLTGYVVSFSWSGLGRLYEVREGRNFVGSGGVAQEGQRDADILVRDDATMSSPHLLILCQGGKYRVSDCNSTNGTYVNGELIDARGIELIDGAVIQAGATVMEFKKLAPVVAARLQSGTPG